MGGACLAEEESSEDIEYWDYAVLDCTEDAEDTVWHPLLPAGRGV